ncbi:hypothetical protein A9G00_37680 [Achromobacter xylosoxidans]|nr:hypothetical protein A9G00_37680 [Achromobacter xylosoxidans]
MMSSTSALLRLAVQRLMSSSIFMLIVNSLDYDVSRFSLGHYMRRLQPDQAPQAQPAWLAPRAEHEMDQSKDYWLLRALALRPGHLEALIAYAQYLQRRWGGS